jgi:ribosomal protein L17
LRHARSGKKLGRDSAHRKALYSNLAGALIEHGRIKTTVTKAKAVRPIAEQMITLGRRGDLHARRQAMAYLELVDFSPEEQAEEKAERRRLRLRRRQEQEEQAEVEAASQAAPAEATAAS